MASTATTIINDVTVGQTASPASNISKVTLVAGTTKLAIQLLYTPVVAEIAAPEVRFAQSIDDLTANAAAVDRLRIDSRVIPIPAMTHGAKQLSTDVIGVKGLYLYVWVAEGVLASPAKLTVKSIEYP